MDTVTVTGLINIQYFINPILAMRISVLLRPAARHAQTTTPGFCKVLDTRGDLDPPISNKQKNFLFRTVIFDHF